MRAHALHTSTNTNINHTRLQRIRNINDSLQATRALSVQTPDSSRLGESSNKRRSTELGGTATRGKDRANCHIVNELGVNAAALDDGLENTGQQVSGRSVLETALAALGDGRAQSACYDDIIGVLLGEGGGSLLATEVGGDLGQALLG